MFLQLDINSCNHPAVAGGTGRRRLPSPGSCKIIHITDEHLDVGPIVTDRDVLITVVKHDKIYLELKRA